MSFRIPDLTPEQRRDLDQAGKDLRQIDREIARAKRAGLDVTTAEETAARYRLIITGLKREFGTRRGAVE